MGGLSANVGNEGDPDRPELETLDNDQVWLISRIVESPSSTVLPNLTLVMVDPVSANPASPLHRSVGGIDIHATHPTFPFRDSMATVLEVPSHFPDHRLGFIFHDMPPSSGVFTHIEGTGIDSTEPDVATNGSEVLVVWRQGLSGSDYSTIDYSVINRDFGVIASGTITESDSDDYEKPAVVFSGTGYGVLYNTHMHIVHSDDNLVFYKLDLSGTPIPDSEEYPGTSYGHLVGRPAFTWDGSRYVVLYEAVQDGESHAHFEYHRFSTDGMGTTRSLNEALGDYIDPLLFTSRQPGMIDIVWTGYNLGVVWVHVNPSTGSHVWFFELDRDGNLVNGPYILNPDATQSFNPAITWVETDTMRYYVFAWNEFIETRGWHVLYSYSYGCSW